MSEVKLAAALHLQAGKLICVFPLGRVFFLFSSLILCIYVGVSGLQGNMRKLSVLLFLNSASLSPSLSLSVSLLFAVHRV